MTLNNILPIWVIILIASLIIAVIALAWLLLRREKALQLIKFSLSPTGIGLTYELNRDKKLELLALENRILRHEISTLKSENFRLTINNILIVFAMILFMVLNRITPGRKSIQKKHKDDNVQQKELK